jgi:diguanylate cyclase (GGDEF)-like protein
VIVAPALANVIAASAVVAGDMTEVSRATAWLSFTAADAVGIVTTLPFFLAIAQRRARWSLELLVSVAATVCAVAVVFLFGDGVHLYLAALPMLWAAIRLGPFGASATSIGMVVTAAFLTARGQGPFAAQTIEKIIDLQVALVSLEVLVIATAVIGGALARERDAAGQQAGSFERILSSLHSVVLTECVWPDESAETVFLGPGYERLLGRPVTRDTTRRAAYDAMHPDDRPAVAANAAYATLASGRETSVDWRVPREMGGYRWLRTRLMPRARVTDGGPVTVDGLIADVTREREILAALAEQGEVVERLTSSIAESVYTLEVLPDGQFVPRFRSESFTALTGGEPPDAPNEAWTDRIHPDDRPGIAAMTDDSWTLEYRLLGADGVERWILDRARRHVTPDGRVFIEGIAADNTERRRAEQSLDEAVARLKVMSETDELTGLANRRVMTDALEQALATAEADGTAVAVVMLDVDRFKQINDTYGHAAGDEVLRELARRFTSLVRQTDQRRTPDLVARWGGEEFCALIADIDDPAAARAVGERIREATVAAPFRLSSGTEIAVTISAGVSVGTGSIEHLVDEADRALYTAKRRGRDQVRLFTDLGPADLVPGDSDAVRLAQALAFAVETREGTQDLHSRHVSDLSGAVAAHLGLPDAMVERCRLAGWLHDVGKLTIPDAVVAADAGGGPAEQEIMKAHATIGDQLVSTMPGLAEAHLGVRHHHERYDGTGYPDGLAGAAIPLEARIVAAADLFSTLTARGDIDRVAAIAAVQQAAGSQLDPQVVAALVAVLLDETRTIAARFGTAA